MSNPEIYSIVVKGVWGILGIFVIKEFISLIKIVGVSSIFQFTKLSEIENPAFREAALRWRRVGVTLFLIWMGTALTVFLLGLLLY